MKKMLLSTLSFLALTVGAQTKGTTEVYPLDGFTLHVYNTNDALGDASFIVESKEGLITMEAPLFKDNTAEFDSYISGLKKKVVKRVADYHIGGTADHNYVMPQGMPSFSKGDIYGGMMAGFASTFGDAINPLPTGKTEEVGFGCSPRWAGITFDFNHGASTDFPAASIIIGKQVYYTHWAPAKAHISPLQVSSAAAIDAEIAEAEKSIDSGCTLFIGGHGGVAHKEDVLFKIAYLKKMKGILAASKNAVSFADAMKKAYPGLPGEAGLESLAQALYKAQ